jgi:ribosomal protein L25 (general stress protein Ctc)
VLAEATTRLARRPDGQEHSSADLYGERDSPCATRIDRRIVARARFERGRHSSCLSPEVP